MSTVAERLLDLRMRAKLTRKELAQLAGLSRSLIGHLERGTRKQPKTTTLTGLAKVLGTDLGYLFSGAGAAPTDRALRKSVELARAQSSEAA